ncbi:MAG: glycosyltransferase family 4 protein [Lentisphaerae bacterium]|nr:glycosyltransferase family 4 protein [Lentisphaerota bacterium]
MFLLTGTEIMAFVKLVVFLVQVVIVKMAGVRIVWTVHNINDHEDRHAVPHRIGMVCIARMANAIVAHSEWAKNELTKMARIANSVKIFVVPHGNFIGLYGNSISRTAARQELGIDDSRLVFLFLGKIRRYKGVLELVEAFNKFGRSDCELLIAGAPFDSLLEAEIKAKLKSRKNIRFYSGVVPDDKVQVYMNACDVAVFPFRRITTSASVVLAMSFGRACIAPRLGGLPEIVNEKGAILYDAGDGSGLERCLNEAFIHRPELDAMGTSNLRRAEHWGWDRIGKMTMDIYTSICK